MSEGYATWRTIAWRVSTARRGFMELRKKSDLPDEAFATYFFLEGRGIEGADKIARESSGAFEDNPHWKESTDQERRVRISLYKALKGSQVKDMVGIVDGLLDLLKKASS